MKKDLDKGYISLTTNTENLLVGICTEVLKIDRIGLRDNFFDLGFESLHIIQMYSRIVDIFSIELPFEIFLSSQDIESLAKQIDSLMCYPENKRTDSARSFSD